MPSATVEFTGYRTARGVAIITLDNPPANTYSYEMMQALDRHILQARMDKDVHVIVLIGAGERFFCAGADIAMLQDVSPDFKYHFCLHANETLLRLEHTPKVTIAALNGHAVGGGLEVALACDLRVASADAGKIGLPEIHLGVLPGTGGTQRLCRLLGTSKAMGLMLEGRNMSVSEAHDMGLIHHILSTRDGAPFVDAVLEYAGQFCPPQRASLAAGLIKRACQIGSDLPLASGLALERELQQRLFTSEDAKEGLAAYLEKREPAFKGK